MLRRILRRVLRGGRAPKKVSPSGPPTAQSQTSVASAAAAAPNPYFDVETLLASVENGAIAAVKGTWLVGLHKRGGRLSRRQALPPEAFWSAGELRRVALALGDDFGVLFVALSYRWLTKEHPDPDGFHLGIVASVAELYLNPRGWTKYGRDQYSQLAAAFREHGLGLPEFALFWDFASLHQSPRTDAEAELFPKGLQNSNVWYGHARTVVWMQSELPEGFAARMRASEPPLAETYEDSGWCYVEAAISAAIKPGFLRLDLAKRTERAMACAYGPGEPWDKADDLLARVCARRRPPPPSPETVRRLLQTEKRFTNSSDVSKVADLYATFFGKVTNVRELKFEGLEWGDADVVELCEVLPRFAALRTLDLSGNKIGPHGASALGEVLKVNAVVTTLFLNCNNIKDEGAKAIAEALKVNAVLKNLRKASARFHREVRCTHARSARENCSPCWPSSRHPRLTQKSLMLAATRSQRRRQGRPPSHPPSRRQARTRDRAVTAGALSHGTTAAHGCRLTACARTSPPARSIWPRWRASEHNSAGGWLQTRIAKQVRATLGDAPVGWLCHARRRVLQGRLFTCSRPVGAASRSPR
jgi:hypothetical protein